MAAIIEVAEDGSLRLPKEALNELHVGSSSALSMTWEVDDGRLVLTPVSGDDDAWAYSPEHVASVLRARGQRGYRLSPADVDELIAAAEEAHRSGRPFSVDEADLRTREARLDATEHA